MTELIDRIKDPAMAATVVFAFEFIPFFNGSNKVFEASSVIANNTSYDWYL